MQHSIIVISLLLLCGLIHLPSAHCLSPVAATISRHRPLFIGFDLGTSGARISVIQSTSNDAKAYLEVYAQAISWDETNSYDNPEAWMNAVSTLLDGATHGLAAAAAMDQVASICISGTSASCLMIDRAEAGKVIRYPRMYNYDVVQSAKDPQYGQRAQQRVDHFAPERHTARSPTGTLLKLLTWQEEEEESELPTSACICHQSDYIALQFLTTTTTTTTTTATNLEEKPFLHVTSDWHNCLKLGYNVQTLQWPVWLTDCLQDAGLDASVVLPDRIVSPGQPMGTISETMSARFGLPRNTVIVGGTTDSNAAFFAACGSQTTMGTAVTSLGSTLAIKQLSSTYIEDATVGIYSHRFPSVFARDEGAVWLVGGASNVGCAVLRQQGFSTDELDRLSQTIDPTTDTSLRYYPLVKKGERFPVSDSNKEPVMEPVPDDRAEFLHGILQGISNVECDGYLALGVRGAQPSSPHTVYTSGGGARNDMWIRMRERRLTEACANKVSVQRAVSVEASYGAAVLAAAHLTSDNSSTESKQQQQEANVN